MTAGATSWGAWRPWWPRSCCWGSTSWSCAARRSMFPAAVSHAARRCAALPERPPSIRRRSPTLLQSACHHPRARRLPQQAQGARVGEEEQQQQPAPGWPLALACAQPHLLEDGARDDPPQDVARRRASHGALLYDGQLNPRRLPSSILLSTARHGRSRAG